MSWRFTSRICCAAILTNATETEIVCKFDDDHNGHSAATPEELDAIIVRNACKMRAKDVVCEKLMRIMR